MATRDEILQLARDARDVDLAGHLDRQRLNPKGQLLLGIGRGEVDLDALPREQQALIGLDPTVMQQVGDVASAAGQAVSGVAGEVAESAKRLPKLFTEGIPTAARTAVETQAAPTLGQELRQGVTPESPFLNQVLFGGVSPIPSLMTLAEQAMRLPVSFGKGAAEVGPEQAKPLTEAIASNAPFLGRAGGQALATDIRGLVGRLRPPAQATPLLPPPSPPPMKALPPATLTGEIVPESMVRPQVGNVLPAGPRAPRALPEAPRAARVRAAEEPPSLIEGRGRVPQGPEVTVVTPKPEPPPLPTAVEVAERKAGVLPKDLTRKTQVLDEFGRPIEMPSRLRGTAPAEPPAAPPAPPTEVPKAPAPPPPVAPAAPAAPPPVPTVGLPHGVEPSPPVLPKKAAKIPRGGMAGLGPESVDVSDPQQVWYYVRGVGGIRKADWEGIPFYFRNKKGLDLDEIVDAIAKAQTRKPKDVERELVHTMQRYGQLRKEGRIAAEKAPPPEVPPEGEKLMGEVPPQFKAEAAEVEPPAPPHFEKTAIGEQALIPGAEQRAMPPTALRPQRPQGEMAETPLFGQERAAEARAAEQAQGGLPLAPPPPPIPPELATVVQPEEWASMTQRARDNLLAMFQDEGGLSRPQVLAFLGRTAAGGAVGGVAPAETPEERARNVALGAGAGAALPAFGRALRGLGERGAMGRPPKVPPEFRREVIRPPEAPRPPAGVSIPSAAERPPGAPPGPAGRGVADQVREVVQQAKNPEPLFAGAPPNLPPGQRPPGGGFMSPADNPQSPAPHLERAARFFRPLKSMFDWGNLPEEVVLGDEGGTNIVRLTYRAYEDKLLYSRELRDHARRVTEGLSPEQKIAVKAHLDTGQPVAPDLAAVAQRIRTEILDPYAEAVGLAPERRLEHYFPRLRDTVRMNTTKLVLDPNGMPYVAKDIIETPGAQKRFEAFFLRTRTATDPSSLSLDAGLDLYAKATGRHLALNGGFHPLTGEPIAGYLNELQPMLNKAAVEHHPYLSKFINRFLGTPESAISTPGHMQLSRGIRNVQAARLMGANLGSPVQNLIQQTNTISEIGPRFWAQGYADMLDPKRRALAQRFLGLAELAKADLDMVETIASKADYIEGFTGKVAHWGLIVFREAEKVNRYNAFLGGLRKAESLGIPERQAIEYARDVVELTQFPGGGPAKPAFMHSAAGATLGQFKQFQMRQLAFAKRAIEEDAKDIAALVGGQQRPLKLLRGQPLLTAEGQPINARRLPSRTAMYLLGLGAIGGPDAIFEGFDDVLREYDIKYPGLLPWLGVSIAQNIGWEVTPQEVTRSLLFFMPGPLVGHIQDAGSAMTGVNLGHGLTELQRDDILRPLTMDERADRALRGFLPVAGVPLARARVAAKTWQTPGSEHAARTVLEALGLEPATGPLMRRVEPGEQVPQMLGLPTVERRASQKERVRLGEIDRLAKQAIEEASSHMAVGDEAAANKVLRDAERALGLSPGTLEVSTRAREAGEKRFLYTPLERQQKSLERRFPLEVEESRQRAPGAIPEDETRRRGLGIPRPRLR